MRRRKTVSPTTEDQSSIISSVAPLRRSYAFCVTSEADLPQELMPGTATEAPDERSECAKLCFSEEMIIQDLTFETFDHTLSLENLVEEHLPVPINLSPIPSTSYSVNRNESPLPSILNDTQFTHLSVTPAQIRPLRKIKSIKENKKEEKRKKKSQKDQCAKMKLPRKKQKERGKGVGRGVSNRGETMISVSDSGSSNENDTKCLFCPESFSKDIRGEGWIQCTSCLKWGHEACAGIENDDLDPFICDLCVRTPGK